MSTNPNTVKSQHELTNEGGRKSDVLLSAIDELEELKKENKRLSDTLYHIQCNTASLGGTKENMEKALLNIDWLCNWALRPDEMKEMEKNNGI